MSVYNDNLTEQMASLRKQKREIAKQEKELREGIKLQSDMGKWQKIMDVRSACKKLIADANIGAMSLTKLEKFPEYIVYQHPVKKSLKTSDRNEEWVKRYLGEIPMDEKGGMVGDEDDLLGTARRTMMRAWKRMGAKKKKVDKYTKKSNKGGVGKGRTGTTGIG